MIEKCDKKHLGYCSYSLCIGRIGGNCGKRSIKIYKLDASVLCYWQVFLGY
jgi:hypothetical protein